jgi:GT2 family glycosyltransferase
VDNASPEGGVEKLRDSFPDVIILKSQRNIGFARANNLGFSKSCGAAVLFLNPDTKLIEPSINILLEQLARLPDAGVLGCKLLNTDSTIQTSCIQTFPTISNQLLDIEYLHLKWPSSPLWYIAPLFSERAEPAKVEVISGACMLMKRGVFERAGRFSEEYFMYAEDLDLCYKVSQLGLSNYYVGATSLVHHGGKSTGHYKVNQWSTIMKSRAVMQFCVKTHGPGYGAVYRAAMGAAAVGRLLALAILFPFGNIISSKDAVRAASAKWSAVFKWAVGLQRLALQD